MMQTLVIVCLPVRMSCLEIADGLIPMTRPLGLVAIQSIIRQYLRGDSHENPDTDSGTQQV